MANERCIFCEPDEGRIFYSDPLVRGMWDAQAVSPGQALLFPRRHVRDWFGASIKERRALTDAIAVVCNEITRDLSPAGFNFGVVGSTADQTIFHLHLDVTPRYAGDERESRRGVRGIVFGRIDYSKTDEPEPLVSDHRGHYEDRDPASMSTALDSASFGERMLQLLDEGQRTSTYKFAVLLALIDLCVEIGAPVGREIAISTRRLAERVLELYWPQTAHYQGERSDTVLLQNTKGQLEIISQIRTFRERVGADGSEPLYRARLRDSKHFERLVTEVEWKLIEMPLPKLQRINKTMIDLLYRIGWDDHVSRRAAYGEGFDRHIYLRPGVSEHLLRLSGLLRPLVQQAWAGMVCKMNRDATDEARLIEFLFGSRRIALAPVQNALRELQDNRCFYCARRIDGIAEVDHFIPWVRHPDNGIENLVVADPRCNNSKRDFLAAAGHVERWAARFRDRGPVPRALADIAARAGWESHSQRTWHTARTIYGRLPGDIRLWLDRNATVAVASERTTLTRALEL